MNYGYIDRHIRPPRRGTAIVRASADPDLHNPNTWHLHSSFARMTQAGERVSPDSANGLSAYFAAVRAISEDIGKLPLKLYRRMERGKEPIPDHPLWSGLHDDANPEMSSQMGRELLTSWALGWGNGYAEVVKDGGGRGTATEWHPIHPSRVTPTRDPETSRIVYEVRSDAHIGEAVLLPPERMFHLRGIGNDLVGYSIAKLASESLGLAIATERFGASFFGNGAQMSGMFSHPGELTPVGYQNLKNSIKEMHGGAGNAYKPFVATEGVAWTQMSVAPEEGQFLESRLFGIEEVARWFRIPPHKLQHLVHAHFDNIEQGAIEYVCETLDPWAVRWCNEIRRKMIAPSDRKDLFAEYLYLGLLRGDQKARGVFYNSQFRLGAMSTNDIREAENSNPVEGGDQHFRELNLIPLDEAPPPPATPDNQPKRVPSSTENGDEQTGNADMPRPLIETTEPTEGADWTAAVRPLLRDVIGRMLAREIRAEVTARKKEQDFGTWVVNYYGRHVDTVRLAIHPVYEAVAALAGIHDAEFVPSNAAMFATFHVELSKREIANTLDGPETPKRIEQELDDELDRLRIAVARTETT